MVLMAHYESEGTRRMWTEATRVTRIRRMLYGTNQGARSSGDSDELPWVDARPAENENPE